MATSQAKVTDSIDVEVNGEPVEVKGPAEDRLDDHKAEFAAFDPGDDEVKGPAEDR